MIQSISVKKKRAWMALAAVFAAVCLLVSCSGIPAYANVDPTWEEEETVIPEEPAEEASPEETVPESEPEQGFTTPGNGDLGDEIKNSSGKDFYTIHTRNNNTFYLVVDHSNNTENVYMLSLIDENDLEEFMDQTEKETEAEVTPAVIIPETPAPTEAPEPETTAPPAEPEQPEKQQPFENSTIWILGAAVLLFALLYYFKIYKPTHEDGEEDSEGIEMGDGLPTERED